ncbi:hypothetical protein BDD12DRAFT_893075 [Trichophaea hybrida]|nr:hypothetical protein BDD12DRAFT_893075 [Trichophaea hybrida]
MEEVAQNSRSTILLSMERSLQQQYGIQQDTKALWDQQKEDYKSKLKLMCGLCANQRYVNDYNLCADSDSSTGSGMMPKSEHTYYLEKGIDTLAENPEKVITKMKAHEAGLQKEDDSEVAVMFSKLRTKSHKRKQSQKPQNTRDGNGSESDGSSSEDEKHASRRTNWTDTQECYRCHKSGHIEQYCPSIAPEEREETAAAWRYPIEGELVHRLCHHLSHLRRSAEDRKAIGYGDVLLRLRLPGGHRKEVIVRNFLHVDRAHNSLSQSRLMDRRLWIVPVNAYGIKIYDKSPAEDSARGRGSHVGIAHQIGGLFQLDVKVAGNRYRARE